MREEQGEGGRGKRASERARRSEEWHGERRESLAPDSRWIVDGIDVPFVSPLSRQRTVISPAKDATLAAAAVAAALTSITG